MYSPERQSLTKKLLFTFPFLVVLPLILVFDSIIYFITRPSCFNCSNLVEFLKNGSLTVFLIGNVGYQLKGKK